MQCGAVVEHVGQLGEERSLEATRRSDAFRSGDAVDERSELIAIGAGRSEVPHGRGEAVDPREAGAALESGERSCARRHVLHGAGDTAGGRLSERWKSLKGPVHQGRVAVRCWRRCDGPRCGEVVEADRVHAGAVVGCDPRLPPSPVDGDDEGGPVARPAQRCRGGRRRKIGPHHRQASLPESRFHMFETFAGVVRAMELELQSEVGGDVALEPGAGAPTVSTVASWQGRGRKRKSSGPPRPKTSAAEIGPFP